MATVVLLLLLAAFVCTIVSAAGKCPLFVPVLLIVVALLVERLKGP